MLQQVAKAESVRTRIERHNTETLPHAARTHPFFSHASTCVQRASPPTPLAEAHLITETRTEPTLQHVAEEADEAHRVRKRRWMSSQAREDTMFPGGLRFDKSATCKDNLPHRLKGRCNAQTC